MARATSPTAGSPYHEGELAAQSRAGVTEEARRSGQIIVPEIPAKAAEFLREQPMVIAASIAVDGQIWASLLTGSPGFLQPRDATTLEILTAPHPGDAVMDTFRRGGPLGLLAIDPERRWRMRLNGVATPLPSGGITIQSDQVYANCPKYIQLRQPEATSVPLPGAATVMHGSSLSIEQQRLVADADTFFIASFHAGGADASHRGGQPGFVRVRDGGRLVFPDYAGNSMFNTLGNLTADPRIGLLFVDFACGDVVQMTGTARIIWEATEVAALGIGEAARAVEMEIAAVVALPGAAPLRWRLVEYSRFNPSVTLPG